MRISPRISLAAFLIALLPAIEPASAAPPLSQGLSAGSATAIKAATPKPILPPTTTVVPNPVLQTVTKVEAPTSLTSAIGVAECAAHGGVFGYGCADKIRAGDVILVWHWSGGEHVDGYKLYSLNGLGRGPQLMQTIDGQARMLATDAAPRIGRCYAVTAIVGTRESPFGNSFCAGANSAAKTIQIVASHVRTSMKTRRKTVLLDDFVDGSPFAAGAAVVGFQYQTRKHTLQADQSDNTIKRTAWYFDTSGLDKHPLVAAKLHLTIDSSKGAGNNHSCATHVGTASEFWWKQDAATWIDGPFTVVPTDTGPEITANVTSIVAPWIAGQPNYGLLLRNDDENLDAFTEKICMTSYVKPILEITYY